MANCQGTWMKEIETLDCLYGKLLLLHIWEARLGLGSAKTVVLRFI